MHNNLGTSSQLLRRSEELPRGNCNSLLPRCIRSSRHTRFCTPHLPGIYTIHPPLPYNQNQKRTNEPKVVHPHRTRQKSKYMVQLQRLGPNNRRARSLRNSNRNAQTRLIDSPLEDRLPLHGPANNLPGADLPLGRAR